MLRRAELTAEIGRSKAVKHRLEAAPCRWSASPACGDNPPPDISTPRAGREAPPYAGAVVGRGHE
ncbi:hypothetical protein MCI89_00300 [Muricomes sp. OA1]|nr:hypothetical protein [Muricomes sp. OA1]